MYSVDHIVVPLTVHALHFDVCWRRAEIQVNSRRNLQLEENSYCTQLIVRKF